MNSAQRRKAKREHPHAVRLLPKANEGYFMHDSRVEDARKWCKKKCKGSWKVNDRWDSAEFKFSDQGDAVIFVLKWV